MTPSVYVRPRDKKKTAVLFIGVDRPDDLREKKEIPPQPIKPHLTIYKWES